MLLSGSALVLFIFLLPETPSSNIFYRRTRRLRKLTGNHKLKCEPELAGEQMTPTDVALMTPTDVALMTLVRPFTLNFTEPMVLLLNLYIALIYGLLYIWLKSFPIVFNGIYKSTLGLDGVAFVGILVGIFVRIPPFFWYLHKYLKPEFNENGEL